MRDQAMRIRCPLCQGEFENGEAYVAHSTGPDRCPVMPEGLIKDLQASPEERAKFLELLHRISLVESQRDMDAIEGIEKVDPADLPDELVDGGCFVGPALTPDQPPLDKPMAAKMFVAPILSGIVYLAAYLVVTQRTPDARFISLERYAGMLDMVAGQLRAALYDGVTTREPADFVADLIAAFEQMEGGLHAKTVARAAHRAVAVIRDMQDSTITEDDEDEDEDEPERPS